MAQINRIARLRAEDYPDGSKELFEDRNWHPSCGGNPHQPSIITDEQLGSEKLIYSYAHCGYKRCELRPVNFPELWKGDHHYTPSVTARSPDCKTVTNLTPYDELPTYGTAFRFKIDPQTSFNNEKRAVILYQLHGVADKACGDIADNPNLGFSMRGFQAGADRSDHIFRFNTCSGDAIVGRYKDADGNIQTDRGPSNSWLSSSDNIYWDYDKIYNIVVIQKFSQARGEGLTRMALWEDGADARPEDWTVSWDGPNCFMDLGWGCYAKFMGYASFLQNYGKNDPWCFGLGMNNLFISEMLGPDNTEESNLWRLAEDVRPDKAPAEPVEPEPEPEPPIEIPEPKMEEIFSGLGQITVSLGEPDYDGDRVGVIRADFVLPNPDADPAEVDTDANGDGSEDDAP